VAFENAGAVASGVEAALKVLMAKGRIPEQKIVVVAFAGDGGTADIGLQSLSGAVERGHDFIYVCLDNEAYMNTGIQKGGLDQRPGLSPRLFPLSDGLAARHGPGHRGQPPGGGDQYHAPV
jgi:thiamine pyrophosphate-dependent acetolactate synthase large subunit-like protein